MSQTKKASLAEAVVNTAVGLVVALAAQRIIFPIYGIHNSYETDLHIVFWFTLVSVARSYVLRRAWNCEWWKRVGFLRGLTHAQNRD